MTTEKQTQPDVSMLDTPPSWAIWGWRTSCQAPPAAPQGPASGADSGKLAQLQLLGELHESGVLTDDEFEREKRRILQTAEPKEATEAEAASARVSETGDEEQQQVRYPQELPHMQQELNKAGGHKRPTLFRSGRRRRSLVETIEKQTRDDIAGEQYAWYRHLLARTAGLTPLRTAVVHPVDENSLLGAVEATQAHLIVPVLIGPQARIRAVAVENGRVI